MQNTNLIAPLCLILPPRRCLLLLFALGSASIVIPGCGHHTGTQNNHTVARPPGPFEIRLPTRSFTPTARLPNWSRLFGKPDLVRTHAIVQLFEIPDPPTRAALLAAGIALGQPLTGRAYLATVRRDVQSTATVIQKIRWVGSLSIKDKLAAELRRAPWARRVPHRIELVVNLFPDADFTAAIRGARNLGGNVLGEAQAASVFTVSLPIGRERDLARFDDIRFVEPMLPAGQGESDRARAHVHTDVSPIPAGRPNGNAVIVGVFDGQHVFIAHPDFGMRALQGDTGAFTPGSHPTMTAGMIAGDGSQSLSQGASSPNQWRGIAPAAFIRSYNFLVPGADPVANYLNHVTKAVQTDGVVVLNNSWGDSGCSPFPYGSYAGRAPFLDGVISGSLGQRVTIVFSAGNERAGFFVNGVRQTNCITNTTPPFANYTTLNHPKSAKNVILVGAIDSANNAMSDYSSWGPTLDGRIKPDVVASGHHNGTMTNGVSHIDNPFGNPVGSSNQQDYRVPINPSTSFVYGWFAQTSSAASIVSGSVALLMDDWRRTFPGRSSPLPSAMRALLVHNAFDLNDATTTWYKPGPDYASGYGLVQVNETLQSLERGDAYEGSVDNQRSVSCPFTLPAGITRFKVTLAWDDPPAIANANPALINDLDLVVTDPAGTRQYPWTLDPTNPSAPAVRTKEDHVNNLEQVQVDAPLAGAWSVSVRGTNVPQGPQSFSLISANGLKCPSNANPPANLTATVALSGGSHVVTVSWTASTSVVVGYDVYRSAQSGGLYTKLNATPVALTGYTDTTVQSGQTYFYVVTAIDSNYVDSVFSNEVSATIP